MAFDFESLKSFNETLEEVKILISISEKNQSENSKYTTYNKSAILLLTAKFENYLESVAREYIDLTNKLCIKANSLPKKIKIQHTLHKLKNLEMLKQSDAKAQRVFNELGLLWNSNIPYETITLDTAFNYGKHGSREIIRFFKKIGFDDIFSKIKVYKKVRSLIIIPKEEIDFKAIFNSAINIRNNIIHGDATPQLTHIDIINYHEHFRQFCKGVCKLLNRNLYILSRR